MCFIVLNKLAAKIQVMEQQNEISLYCLQMQEIISRDKLLRQLMNGQKSLGNELYDYEIFALNMRKILELIAFSSLIVVREEYALKHKNFHEHYRSKAILKEIEQIHPNFFPTPGIIEEKQDGTKNIGLPLTAGNALTRSEFEELYDCCTSIIHVWKPYNQNPKEINFRLAPIEWLNKVRDLLNVHYVHLPKGEEKWLCLMHDSKDHKPHVYSLKKVD